MPWSPPAGKRCDCPEQSFLYSSRSLVPSGTHPGCVRDLVESKISQNGLGFWVLWLLVPLLVPVLDVLRGVEVRRDLAKARRNLWKMIYLRITAELLEGSACLYESKGRKFESCRAHHNPFITFDLPVLENPLPIFVVPLGVGWG